MLHDIKAYAQSPAAEKYMIDKLSKLISIPSTVSNPEMKKVALSVFLEFAKSEGYSVEDNGEYGSVLLLNPCTDIEIGIIVHLDVVPAGTGWTFEPFNLTRWNNLLIGRGVLDDKGPAIVAFTAMKYFLDNKVPLPFSIRLFLGCNEESGMSEINDFLLSHKAPDFSFTPDNAFPVCCGENGIATIMISSDIGDDIVSFMGKTIVNSPASYAKAVFLHDFSIQIKESDLRSCIHRHKNIIEVMDTYTSVGKSFNAIEILCQHMYENEVLLENTRNAIELVLVLSAIGFDEHENMYTQMSDSSYLYFRCDSVSVKNNKLITKYLVRYAATSSIHTVIANIKKILRPYNYCLTLLHNHNGSIFTSDSEQVSCLLDAYYETTGMAANPFFDNYGSYASSLPNTVGFGMRTPMPHSLLGRGRGNMHEKDEYISIDEMKTALEIYIRAIDKLSKLYGLSSQAR